jgi:hypothetical protein
MRLSRFLTMAASWSGAPHAAGSEVDQVVLHVHPDAFGTELRCRGARGRLDDGQPLMVSRALERRGRHRPGVRSLNFAEACLLT